MKLLYSLSCPGIRRAVLTSALGLAVSFLAALAASAQGLFRQLSQDSFTDPAAQHMTEVEPRRFRPRTGDRCRLPGSSHLQRWRRRYRLGDVAEWWNYMDQWIPCRASPLSAVVGTNSAASDASVAYDAKHGMWLISTLPIGAGDNVAVSRSTDGIHWGNPIYVTQAGDADKNWIICDNTSTSPFYGNCYVGWDNSEIQMSTSSDGGLTWGAAKATAAGDFGIGVNPVVQPNGTVVVGFADYNGGMSAFTSTNGGQSWSAAVSISSAPSHGEAGGMRSAGLPSTAIDGAGKVYVSWPDCRFESGCAANDIVYSSSTDGIHWSSVVRVPIDPIEQRGRPFHSRYGDRHQDLGKLCPYGDHLLLLSSLELWRQLSACSRASRCRMMAEQTWTAGRQLSGSMQLSWLPQHLLRQNGGRLRRDSVPGGRQSFPDLCHRASADGRLLPPGGLYRGLTALPSDEMTEPRMSSKDDKPIPGAKSDHPARRPEDRDNEIPGQPDKAPPAK